MVIKVFILLQEKILVTNTHERVSEEKIRKGSAGLFYSSPSRASFLPSLQGGIPVCLPINGYTEKAGKCPPDPQAIRSKCPHDDPLTICFSLPLP